MDVDPPETDTHDCAHAHELHFNRAPTQPSLPPLSSVPLSHPQALRRSIETTQTFPSSSRPATAATSVQTFAPMSEEKVDEDRVNSVDSGAVEDRSEMRATSTEPMVDMRQLGERQSGGVEHEHEHAGDGTDPEEGVPQTPQTSLTFLLVSGRRKTMSFEPDMAVGRVKELIWNAWPGEWQDERPPAPSHLRILYLGKILQDEDTLRKLDFKITTPPAPPQPTIVHLSIRPFLPPSEDDTLKKKSRASIVRRGFSRHSAVTGGQEFGQGGGGADGRRTSGQPEDGANAGGCCGCVIC